MRVVHDLPRGCVTPSALRSLATRLDQLRAFHSKLGGSAPDEPCLTELHVDHGTTNIVARVRSGDRWFQLILHNGSWDFQ